jgi:hypothetical protein
MARILDHESYIIFLREVDTGYYIIDASNINRVADIVAQLAGRRLWGERITCLVLKIRVHNLGRMV